MYLLKINTKLSNQIIQQLKDSENHNIVVYLLRTLLSFHVKESDASTRDAGTRDSVTVLTIES